jgi:AAA15 family ATPase/GTPase
VFIGGNATGKTTLLKAMYHNIKFASQTAEFVIKNKDNPNIPDGVVTKNKFIPFSVNGVVTHINNTENPRVKYIPEKDILEHAKGLLPFIMEKQTGFNDIYMDVLLAAYDVPTQEQNEMQKSIGNKIADIIGGVAEWDNGDNTFYIVKTDGSRIPFVNEASGYKRLGFLGLLVSCGKLIPNSVLLWDEPENSLNPELVPKLVDILLELSRNGVQIFIATHSELLADYFNTIRKSNDEVMFVSLYKDGETIRADTNDRFDLLRPNKLMEEPVKLYEAKLDRRFGDVE